MNDVLQWALARVSDRYTVADIGGIALGHIPITPTLGKDR